MDNADDLMMASYEDQQSGTDPVDDLDGFEFGFDDETQDEDQPDEPLIEDDDDDEPMPEWPTADDKRDAELHKPVLLTDDEMAQIQSEWDRYGDSQEVPYGR